jgi:hypothetical protein
MTMVLISVSIQLVSPTSGELVFKCKNQAIDRFHSISFPNEWGVLYDTPKTAQGV